MRKVIVVVLVAMLSGACGLAWAAPLAPQAKLDATWGTLVKPDERKVPTVSEAGIPAYPGSRFCTIDKGSSGATGWSEAHLLSVDSYEKVSAWYRTKMDGWYCREWSKGRDFTCSDKDPGEAGNYDPETFNVVDVVKTGHPDPCAMQGVQTGINIRFQPD